jgi:large subunit ribosomal protein L31
MKKEIHPEYMDAKVICGCGTITETMATTKEIHVDICSSCHPFYTGTQKLVDTAGRVEKFRQRAAKASK